MDDLRELYQTIILEHHKRPHHFGPLEGFTHQAQGYNPLCGDEVTLYLKINNHIIEDITFTGQGCAISRASASLMTDELKGKTLEQAQAKSAWIKSLLIEKTDTPLLLEEVGDLAALSGVRQFPARIKCATLAWHAFEEAVQKKPDPANA